MCICIDIYILDTLISITYSSLICIYTDIHTHNTIPPMPYVFNMLRVDITDIDTAITLCLQH